MTTKIEKILARCLADGITSTTEGHAIYAAVLTMQESGDCLKRWGTKISHTIDELNDKVK